MRAERVVICGQGPSWAQVDVGEVAQVRNAGATIIAVNGAIEHVAADIFFTLDLSEANRNRIRVPRDGVRYVVAAPEAENERLEHVTYLDRVAKPVPGGQPYHKRAGREAPGGLSDDPAKIHTGNSAFGALNLAYHMGATRVALLGVDGHGSKRWDGGRNLCLDHVPDLFASAVPQLNARGIGVVNGSPDSAVECFPRMTPHDALDWLINGGSTAMRPNRSMGTGLVLGGAACLWNDLRALGPVRGPVIATNEAGVYYPHRIDHWATLHPEKLPQWKRERATRGGNVDYREWTQPMPGWDKGSSGLHAVAKALWLGCEPVVVCGMPMDTDPHFFDAKPWTKAEAHWPVWLERQPDMTGRVYSMSGRTRELLGAPPWL